MRRYALFLALVVTAAGIPLARAEMVPLRVLNRCTIQAPPIGTDRYTTTTPTEQCTVAEGQTFYILGQIPNSVPLYRLLNPQTGDHIDYLATAVPGYQLEGTLGWVYGAQDPGTDVIQQQYLAGDYATGQTNDPPGYFLIGPMGFGYPRYHLNRTDLVTVTGGDGIVMKANRVAGGSIWELTWNGKQFINHLDYGRELQSAVFWLDPGNQCAWYRLHNPTQGGDVFGEFHGTPWPWFHGSPVTTLSVSGNVLTTLSIPLEFEPRIWDGDPSNDPCPFYDCPCTPNQDPYGEIPIIYRGWQLGQTFTVGLPGLPRVIKTDTQLTSDTAIPFDRTTGPGIQTIAFVLGGENEFAKYYTWTAVPPPLGADVRLTDVTSQVPNCFQLEFGNPDAPNPTGWTGAGGVITATPNGNYALGVYGRKPSDGGGVTFFQIVRGWGPACGTSGTPPQDPYSGVEYSGIAALRQAAISVGTATYRQYFVVGTLQSVQDDMLALYNAGL